MNTRTTSAEEKAGVTRDGTTDELIDVMTDEDKRDDRRDERSDCEGDRSTRDRSSHCYRDEESHSSSDDDEWITVSRRKSKSRSH